MESKPIDVFNSTIGGACSNYGKRKPAVLPNSGTGTLIVFLPVLFIKKNTL